MVKTTLVTTRGLVCTAIRERRLLEFDYNGSRRVVAAYCHGTSTAGSEVLRAIEVRGASGAKGDGFGKLWNVAKIANPILREEKFVPDDPHYNPDDKGMRHIHCRIDT